MTKNLNECRHIFSFDRQDILTLTVYYSCLRCGIKKKKCDEDYLKCIGRLNEKPKTH